MDYEQSTAKVRDLIQGIKVCMLTTMTSDGRHVSRPMSVQDTEFDDDLWFFAYADSSKAQEIGMHPQVNVAFSDSGSNTWVSLSGSAEVVEDRAKADELWNPLLKAWFTDGLDTLGLCLIKVHADSAEYWDAPNGKAVMLFGAIKAAVTGEPPKAGDNQTVQL
jgi:general stress protein 26